MSEEQTGMKEFYTAFAKFQGELKTVKKDKTVKVKMKTGGAYEFSYADLASIWDAIRKPLSDNGFSVLQIIENQQGDMLKTILCHKSGSIICSTMRLNCTGNDIKGMGAAITYYRRYALSALLGIVSDDDVDSIESEGADGAFDKAIDSGRLSHIQVMLKGKEIMEKHLISHYGDLSKIPLVEFESVCKSIASFQEAKKPTEKVEVTDESKEKIKNFFVRHADKNPKELDKFISDLASARSMTKDEVILKAIENEERFLKAFDASRLQEKTDSGQ